MTASGSMEKANTFNARTNIVCDCNCGERHFIVSADLSEAEIMHIVRGRILSSSFHCSKCGDPISYLLSDKTVDLCGEAFECASLCIEIAKRQGRLLRSIDEAEQKLSDLEEEMFGSAFSSNILGHDGEIYVGVIADDSNG